MICTVCRRPLFRSAVEGRSIGPVCARKSQLLTSKRRIARHADAGTMDLFEPTKNETLLREQQGL
jgi:uncharacterized Zn finger protein (UPF0148 family)